MMKWYQIISYFFTNEIRIFLCLLFVAALLKFPMLKKSAVIFSLGGGIIITAISLISLSQFYLIGAEIIILIAIVHYLFPNETRMCLFLIFIYEVGVALWEFLTSSWMGVLFQSSHFVDNSTIEYLIAIWIERLLMLAIAMLAMKKRRTEGKDVFRIVSIIAALGLFGVVALSEQSFIVLNDSILTTWTILSTLLIMSILFFKLNRQYQMEREIARLKADQAELLERDYQSLNNIYTTNAKLYHDLHNHIEVLYNYLTQGKADDAIEYLEDLRNPIREISQTVWTGDKAIDYLISSKASLARQIHIHLKINIEFPRHTNIRSTDLTAILGNLLDNALEAAQIVNKDSRFINLTIRRINNMLIIKVENSCETVPILESGKLQTSKSDKLLHGWGLKSACATAERYDGIIETSYDNNIFRAVVTLSYKAVQIK